VYQVARPARSEDREIEPVLNDARVRDPEPAEQIAICGAASQEKMLAIIDRQPAPQERTGGAA
jgi:hypothetical protein